MFCRELLPPLADNTSWLSSTRSPRLALSCYGTSACLCAPVPMKENRPMKMLAYLLAIICTIAAVMYYVIPAGSLPTFMPGYEAGSTHIHHLHAYAALVVAVVLFGVGWFSGRR
jgi:hypothetical protein